MADQTPRLSAQEQRAERAMQRALAAPRLSASQRERHLRRIANARQPRTPSRRTAVALAAGAAVAVLALALVLPTQWMSRQPSPLMGVGPSLDSGRSTAAARPTAPAGDMTTDEGGSFSQSTSTCVPSAPAADRPSGPPEQLWDEVWYQLGSIWLMPTPPGAGGDDPTGPAGGFWYAGVQTMSLIYGDGATHELQFTLLDAETGEPTRTHVTATIEASGSFMQTTPDQPVETHGSIALDTTGCWQITSPGVPDAVLVIEVLPFEERSDVQDALAAQRDATILEPPSDYDADDWEVADPFGYAYAVYVLERGGIVLEIDRPGVLRENTPQFLAIRGAEGKSISVHVTSTDRPDVVLDIATKEQDLGFGPRHTATLLFPKYGCWILTISVDGRETAFNLYVQPRTLN